VKDNTFIESMYYNGKDPEETVSKIICEMIEIKVKTRFRKKMRKLPESFNEMTKKQLLYFIGLLSKGLNEDDVKLRFVNKYLKLPYIQIDNLKKEAEKCINQLKKKVLMDEYYEHNSKIHLLLEKFQWITKERNLTIPKIKRLGLLYGPGQDLKDLEIWQYARAEKEWNNHRATNEEKYIDLVIGALFRKRTFIFFGKKRKWNEDKIKSYAKSVKNIDYEKKIAIMMFFEAVRDQFSSMYPELFKVVTQDQTSNEPSNWADIIIDMSGDIPGTEDKVSRVNLHAFLYRMNKNIKDHEEYKRKNKQNGT